jgi:ubiquinol oxidase
LGAAGCRLPADARLREVIVAVRADEAGHRDVNHEFSYKLKLAAE